LENLNRKVFSSASSGEKIKVLVVDDQKFICMLVKKIIENSSAIECVGFAQDGEEASRQIQASRPDVVVLDWELPGTDSIELMKKIQNYCPHISFLIFTSHEEEEYVSRAIRAGAKGYLLKGCSEQELVDGICSVHKGYAQLSAKLLADTLKIKPKIVSPPSDPDLSESDQIWSTVTTEKLESLPRVSLRLLLYVLLGSVAIALPWLFLAQFEEIAQVQGKIEPHPIATIVDAPTGGKVTHVKIRSGQKVKVNQTLLRLDSKLTLIELLEQQNQLKTQQKRLDRLKIVKNQAIESLRLLNAQFNPEKAEKQAQIRQAYALIEAKKSELIETSINLEGANAKLQRYQKAQSEGALSVELLSQAQTEVKQAHQNIVQAQTEIEQAKSFYLESQEALSILLEAQKIKAIEAQKELEQIESEILSVGGEIKQIQHLIASLSYQAKSQIISAPINGVIFDLAIDKPGSVIERGETLVSIAPQKARFVFRGQILSKDVGSGFLKLGMPARIKLDSFPWREFGLVRGKISWISPNSKQVNDLESTYSLEIELNQWQNIKVRDHLNFGQTGIAEVIVRKKKILDFY
jgi:hemolysin D